MDGESDHDEPQRLDHDPHLLGFHSCQLHSGVSQKCCRLAKASVCIVIGVASSLPPRVRTFSMPSNHLGGLWILCWKKSSPSDKPFVGLKISSSFGFPHQKRKLDPLLFKVLLEPPHLSSKEQLMPTEVATATLWFDNALYNKDFPSTSVESACVYTGRHSCLV